MPNINFKQYIYFTLKESGNKYGFLKIDISHDLSL